MSLVHDMLCSVYLLHCHYSGFQGTEDLALRVCLFALSLVRAISLPLRASSNSVSVSNFPIPSSVPVTLSPSLTPHLRPRRSVGVVRPLVVRTPAREDWTPRGSTGGRGVAVRTRNSARRHRPRRGLAAAPQTRQSFLPRRRRPPGDSRTRAQAHS